MAEQNTVYRCVNQCVIEKSSGTLVIGTGRSYIPSDGSVTVIGPHAFEGNARLTSLDIPLSVTTIGANAFNGCYNLRNVAYPGAQEDWDAIVIGENNAPLLGASLSLHIHTYVEEVITPATCTQEGLKRYTCSQCGKTFTAVVPISHPDADFDGVCDRCGLDFCDIHAGETKSISVNAGQTVMLRFVPAVSGRYTLRSSTLLTKPQAKLYDADHALLAQDNNSGSSFGVRFELEYDLIMGQTYYFGCSFASASVSGSYSVTLTLDQPLETLLPAAGAGTVIDPAARLIYGLAPNVTDPEAYFTAKGDYTCAFTGQVNGTYSTGTNVIVYDGTTPIACYALIVFGDVDGDGVYDGTDAYFTGLYVNGMLGADAFTAAQLLACDATRDGTVDAADVALLEQAGLLLAEVSQSTPADSLGPDSANLAYCSLIDQTVALAAPAADEEPAAAQQGNALQMILNFFRLVYEFLSKLFLSAKAV